MLTGSGEGMSVGGKCPGGTCPWGYQKQIKSTNLFPETRPIQKKQTDREKDRNTETHLATYLDTCLRHRMQYTLFTFFCSGHAFLTFFLHFYLKNVDRRKVRICNNPAINV